MTDNRSFNYDDHMGSYGMQEIQHEAKKAQLLKEAGLDTPPAKKAKQTVWRFASAAIAIALLIFFFSFM